SGPVEVLPGGQLDLAGATGATLGPAAQVFIAGTGAAGPAGTLGALRLSGSTYAGALTLTANASVANVNATPGTLSRTASGPFDLEFRGSSANDNSTTAVATPNTINVNFAANTTGSTRLTGQLSTNED